MTEHPVSLREYLELEIRLVRTELDAVRERLYSERGILLEMTREREANMERRLNALNELRNEVLKDRNLFITKDTFEAKIDRLDSFLPRDYFDEQHAALKDRVDANADTLKTLQNEVGNLKTRFASYAAAFGASVLLITVLVAVLTFVLRK